MARRLPEPGGLRGDELGADRPRSRQLHLSVRAVDSAFNAGPAAEGTLTIAAEALFSDGFESGDVGAWTTSVP
jgi:hypothetical protein